MYFTIFTLHTSPQGHVYPIMHKDSKGNSKYNEFHLLHSINAHFIGKKVHIGKHLDNGETFFFEIFTDTPIKSIEQLHKIWKNEKEHASDDKHYHLKRQH